MQRAMDETQRRREIQQKYNKDHGIIPQTIKKDIRASISGVLPVNDKKKESEGVDFSNMKKSDQKEMIESLENQMRQASKQLNFEDAATLRDTILELKAQIS